MPHKRKGTRCLNCPEPLSARDNFCNICGQENDNRNVSFWELATDFIEESLGVDSKFWKSMVPFIMRPGKMTVSFISGQRKVYVPPLRLYLVFSVLCFLMLSLSKSEVISTDEDRNSRMGFSEAEIRKEDSLDFVQNRKQWVISTKLKLKKATLANDTGLLRRTKINLAYLDTVRFQFDPYENLSISLSNISALNQKVKLSKVQLYNPEVTAEMIADSLGWDHSFLSLRFISQARKLTADRNGGMLIGTALIENASTASFLMVPLLAFALWLIFIRRKFRYVAHLVHAVHIQSFIFLLISLNLGTSFLLKHAFSTTLSNVYANFSILGFIMIYTDVSFFKVYMQPWYTTLLSTIVGMVAYITCVIIVIIPLTVFSFLFF